jgi:predicted O-methyltransferase YrrM
MEEMITIWHGKALDILPEVEKAQSAPFDFIFIDAAEKRSLYEY